jgi:hypothetical protein
VGYLIAIEEAVKTADVGEYKFSHLGKASRKSRRLAWAGHHDALTSPTNYLPQTLPMLAGCLAVSCVPGMWK